MHLGSWPPAVLVCLAAAALMHACFPDLGPWWQLSPPVRAPVRDSASVVHVILPVSNPLQYTSRFRLANACRVRLERNFGDAVRVYVVELAYGGAAFGASETGHPQHLQLRTDSSPVWSKENLINIGVATLLPPDWAFMAWLDTDVEFDSPHTFLDVQHLLSGGAHDIVQLFSHAIDLNAAGHTAEIYSGFAYQLLHHVPYGLGGVNYFHPGFAWAITHAAYQRIGGYVAFTDV
jgi:hypothetical protein